MEKDNFLWHKVSEQERKSIKEEAKKIMDNFSKALSKIERDIPEQAVERDKFEREEGNKLKKSRGNENFRKLFFENAPEKKEDCLVAEKKKWA